MAVARLFVRICSLPIIFIDVKRALTMLISSFYEQETDVESSPTTLCDDLFLEYGCFAPKMTADLSASLQRNSDAEISYRAPKADFLRVLGYDLVTDHSTRSLVLATVHDQSIPASDTFFETSKIIDLHRDYRPS